MPVSAKLTFWVLVVPLIFMVSVFVVGFNLYRSSFDASAFSTAVSSLLSAVFVILLVWERLRDSLFKKLEYLQKNIFSVLYNREFRDGGDIFLKRPETKRLRSDLEKYGKFIRLTLYPRSILRKIDSYLLMHDEFYKRWTEICEMAMRQIPTNWSERDFAQYMGINPNYRGKFADNLDQQYTDVSNTISKDNSKLTSEMKLYFEKTTKLGKEIFDQLEDFLKRNSIELEPRIPVLYT